MTRTANLTVTALSTTHRPTRTPMTVTHGGSKTGAAGSATASASSTPVAGAAVILDSPYGFFGLALAAAGFGFAL